MFLFCLVFAMFCVRLFICALWSPAGKGLTSWLSFVVSNCEFVTFPLVSWVRCGTLLYRFLIFAPLLTLKQRNCYFGPNLRPFETDFFFRIRYQHRKYLRKSFSSSVEISFWCLLVLYVNFAVKCLKFAPNFDFPIFSLFGWPFL